MFVPACLLSDWWKTKLELADVWVEIAMANGDICSTRQTMGGGGNMCMCDSQTSTREGVGNDDTNYTKTETSR